MPEGGKGLDGESGSLSGRSNGALEEETGMTEREVIAELKTTKLSSCIASGLRIRSVEALKNGLLLRPGEPERSSGSPTAEGEGAAAALEREETGWNCGLD